MAQGGGSFSRGCEERWSPLFGHLIAALFKRPSGQATPGTQIQSLSLFRSCLLLPTAAKGSVRCHSCPVGSPQLRQILPERSKVLGRLLPLEGEGLCPSCSGSWDPRLL